MNNLYLQSEILELIERRAEGDYWDFKQQWHSNHADLIHDIICMANSPANRDCYLIIGIEDTTYDILGVDAEKGKNQQELIDLLRRKPKWAGGYIPEVYVKQVLISDKEIDVIIIKQSNNTPFYLLEDYKKQGNTVFKGSIYTRKGDTNTPRDSTADIYDTEILWKRRLGLLYSPSQRAKFYLMDLENWERIDEEEDKFGIMGHFFFYKLDPDYTICFKRVSDEDNTEIQNKPKNINDDTVGSPFYYLYAFCNVSYHTDFSNGKKVVLYYKDIPLFSSLVESIDEGRTQVIPPEFLVNPYYIKDSFRYLIFEFVFAHWCVNYSGEAKIMLMRVIPIYKNDSEYNEFMNYIKDKGYSYNKICEKQMCGEALTRFNDTKIGVYDSHGNPSAPERISEELKGNTNLVINFAHPNNKDIEGITKHLRTGKMLVDWLDDWRNGN